MLSIVANGKLNKISLDKMEKYVKIKKIKSVNENSNHMLPNSADGGLESNVAINVEHNIHLKYKLSWQLA